VRIITILRGAKFVLKPWYHTLPDPPVHPVKLAGVRPV
jgi:hypothetical protein